MPADDAMEDLCKHCTTEILCGREMLTQSRADSTTQETRLVINISAGITGEPDYNGQAVMQDLHTLIKSSSLHRFFLKHTKQPHHLQEYSIYILDLCGV